ncbi:hypothetical protein L208DRAFT_1337502, partial [Tricholoma matsutake]
TGVASVSCSRHQMFRPTGTVDLQKGERYANIDFVFMSSVFGFMLLSLIVSYDIACQWYKHFWDRLELLLAHLQFLNIRRFKMFSRSCHFKTGQCK